MNRRFGMAWAAAGSLLLAACNGWPTTKPYTEARTRPEPYETYAYADPQQVPMFYAGNHRMMVLPVEVNTRYPRLTGVNANAPVSVFALAGASAPYSTLFARTQDGPLHVVAPID